MENLAKISIPELKIEFDLPFLRSFILDVNTLSNLSKSGIWVNYSNNSLPIENINFRAWKNWLLSEEYRTPHRLPFSARLPFHYHRIPTLFRVEFAKKLFYSNQRLEISGFGIDLLELLLKKIQPGQDKRFLMLTHDIDTEGGFSNIKQISNLELRFGFQSLWNYVPKKYLVNHEVLENLKLNGNEIGIHGIWHNNREAFLHKNILRREFRSLIPEMKKYDISAYRGPSWYRTKNCFDVLSEFFKYDLSCLDHDFICPGEPGGVFTSRPYKIRPNLIEIPCTIPFEAPLFYGVSPNKLLEFWIPKIDLITCTSGFLVVNTHPDKGYLSDSSVFKSYKELLDRLYKSNWKVMLPSKLEMDVKNARITIPTTY